MTFLGKIAAYTAVDLEYRELLDTFNRELDMESNKKITAYEIDDLGVDHSQYFQGAGISYTVFNDVAVGVGTNAKEAYNDAVEVLSQDWDTNRLPKHPRGIRASDSLTEEEMSEESEFWYYVAIRVR